LIDRAERDETLLQGSQQRGTVEIESDPGKRGIGKTVLVVDDYALIRKLLATAFLSDGFKKCGETANGKEAIELAKRIKPDVVTLDFSMPGLSGLDVAPVLRKMFPKMPIILFSLYADRNLEIEAGKVGIDLVLLKTVPVPTLIDKAHELVG
jgi:two-component system, chemotaxis family, chemotaxis protein CheY